MIELGRIYNEDCLETMKRMEDKSVDLIVTDPPYGIGETNEKNATRSCMAKTTNFGHYDWDTERIGADVMGEILRVSKNQIIFGGNYYSDMLPPSACWVVWDKDNGENDFADCELAWGSFDSAVRKFKWRWQGMLQEDMKNKEARVHPTQKPVPLIAWIVNRYSESGALIYDPFMGSGTTAVACEKLGRRWIGSEINPDYCKIAEKRIEAVRAQGNLFP